MADNTQKVVEFRGCDNLVFAEVTKDEKGSGGYVTGDVEQLAPIAEISKTVESSSEAKYYDNRAMLTVNSEGADEITLTVPALPIKKIGKILGKTVDTDTGALLDGSREEKYFALGYRTKLTDGTYRYVWRLKGSFSIPDEKSTTENNGTDSNNQELKYTGISTTHEFTKGGSVKGVVVDERDGLADVSTFFDEVTTPDTLQKKTI